MLRYRPDLDSIRPYVPGRGEQEILDDYGLEAVVKLASNECPFPPFPQVVEAIREAAAGVNRYPETVYRELGAAVGAHLGVPSEALWFGGGGAELLREMTLGVAGPGTTVVFPHPSFVVYGLATTIAGATPVPVPLDADHRLDLPAMGAAVRDDTTLLFVCNPNNPTGTHVPTDAVRALIDAVPPEVLIVVDEAYLHYVAAADYETLVPLTQERENVVVLHTFSKIYSLAGLRVGYAVGRPEVVAKLRRTQLPFTASSVGQAAALEAMRHQDQVAERVAQNAEARAALVDGLAARGVPQADSQTNFVFCRLAGDPAAMNEALLERGVIVRPTGTPWTRVSTGTLAEMEGFFAAYDSAVAAMG